MRNKGRVLLALWAIFPVACNRLNPTASSDPRTQLRTVEDQIKASATASALKQATHSLEVIAEIKNPVLMPMPVAVLPKNESTLLILDNNRSRLYEVALKDNGVILQKYSLPDSLEYPSKMLMKAKDLYVLADSELAILNRTSNTTRIIKHFYSAHDLALHGDNIYLALNPSTVPDAPLAVEIDPSGKRIGSLWHDDFKNRTGLQRKVSLASCKDTIAAAPFHTSDIYIFHPPGSTGQRVHLAVPAEQQLNRLALEPGFVNPSPHIFILPTFLSGVACSGDSIFVSLDMPFPYIYELDLSGNLKAILAFPKAVQGRHFRSLAVQQFQGHFYFYMIATDSDQSNQILVLKES